MKDFFKKQSRDECQNCQQGVEKLFGNYVSEAGLAYQKEILYSICSDPIFDQVDCEIDIDLYWPKVASIIYSPFAAPGVCKGVHEGACDIFQTRYAVIHYCKFSGFSGYYENVRIINT